MIDKTFPLKMNIKLSCRVILSAWISLCVPGILSAQSSSIRPNVLFIAVDDLNDWIGSLGGNRQTLTPNFDRLAARSVLFTNAHCAAPACNPSRAALMTGIRPSTSGVYHNPQPWRESPVLKNAPTIPQHFMANGYTAVGSGKIYHGSFPDPASWQEYWPSQTKNKPNDPAPVQRPVNGIPKTAHFDWGAVQMPNEKMGDWQVADWVNGRLKQAHDQPFFIACGFYRPHLPWYVPQEYFSKFPLGSIKIPEVPDSDLDDVPDAGRRMAKPNGDHAKVVNYHQWEKAVQGYLASVNFVDACLGRVLDALDASPHKDETIVVLWSDHGWHLGEKKHWRKFSLWEEATQVVMMWSVPGLTKEGVRCDAPVNLLDIYPTLIELCDLPANNRLEGTSLAPLLNDPEAEWNRPALTTHGRNNHAIRSDRYRYIRYADGSEELYDHEADEMEWTNIAAKPDYNAVKSDLARWLPEVNVPESPRRRNR